MSDNEALQLLRLLHQYVTFYGPDAATTIVELAEDLTVSALRDQQTKVQRLYNDIVAAV